MDEISTHLRFRMPINFASTVSNNHKRWMNRLFQIPISISCKGSTAGKS